jgi:Yip1 domain
MNLVERAKNICLTPKSEWDVIAPETTDTKTLLLNYAAPLAAIGVVAGFIGNVVVGHSTFLGVTVRTSVISGLMTAIFSFAIMLGMVFIWSLVIDALAPSFGAEKNKAQALKVATYSGSPVWLASIVSIFPSLSPLILLAAFYALYVMYLGLRQLMKSPEDKAIGYAAVVAIVMMVAGVILGVIMFMIGIGGMMGGGMSIGSNSTVSTADSSVTFDKDSALGKFSELGKKMEAANKKMDAAQKSGDQQAQMNAAMESLGTLMGGGKRVDPLGIEQLKPFVPETIGGLPKTASNTEKTGVAGLMVSKAEATYSDGAGKEVRLEITDSGGASGVLGLANWVGVQGEKEDQNGSEKTAKVNGRMVHEKVTKSGNNNEYSVVLGDRFVVSAKGRGVDIATLKGAVTSLDLSKLEGMKDVGVQKQ